MPEIFSRFDKFLEKFSHLEAEKESRRGIALKQYLSNGTVIRASGKDRDWPTLIYPTPAKIGQDMSELNETKKYLLSKHSDWKKKFSDAQHYDLTQNIKKFKEKLYWQHVYRIATDKDYRSDAETVKLPVHLVADPRWKPMVKMFVKDLEYRKQLTETVKSSIVYKKDRKVGKFADDLKIFRMEEAGKKIKELEEKIQEIDANLEAGAEIMKWAKS